MFICASCKKSSEPREPQTKVVIEKRAIIYDNGGRGFETVREIAICHTCVLHSGYAPHVMVAASMAEVKRSARRMMVKHSESLNAMGSE